MNRPIFHKRIPFFRRQITATLDGEVVNFGTEEWALEELISAWPPEFDVHCAPPKTAHQENFQGAAPKRTGKPPEPFVLNAPPKEKHEEVFPMARAKPGRGSREEWLLGFASQFRKAVDAIDRKLQGRILEAISDIAKSPITNRGDTVQQLTGDMKGFWRYRIGDFRLLYYPDESTHTVTLCDFASRGDIYD